MCWVERKNISKKINSLEMRKMTLIKVKRIYSHVAFHTFCIRISTRKRKKKNISHEKRLSKTYTIRIDHRTLT